MKKTSLLLLLLILMASPAFAEMMMPKSPPVLPPLNNPHPPKTAIDKKRVAFALAAIEIVLQKKITVSNIDLSKNPLNGPNIFNNKDLACLKDIPCIGADNQFVYEFNTYYGNFGLVKETRHAHVIPWSIAKFNKPITNNNKPIMPQGPANDDIPLEKIMADRMDIPNLKADEYMVHVYVRFGKYPDVWYHLDVILSETSDGKIYLRHFFTTPIPNDPVSMPPGVVC